MKTPQTVRLRAVGDISFTGSIQANIARKGAGWALQPLRKVLRDSDILFGSLESVFLPPGYPQAEVEANGLVSIVDAAGACNELKRCGFSFINLATNHILDAGEAGMLYTEKALSEAGVVSGGIGATQEEARTLKTLQIKGIKFGFLCYCEDNNYVLSAAGPSHAYFTLSSVLEDVARHRPAVDILVVSIHADLEFSETPSYPRYSAARKIAKAGADIILQHHPHVPQGIEIHEGKLIAYSLGNFLFPAHSHEYMQRAGPRTALSYVLSLEVGKTGVRSFERIPVEIRPVPDERPHLAGGEKALKLHDYLLQLDRMLLDPDLIKRAWRERALMHFAKNCRQAGLALDPDILLENFIVRMLLVAENRHAMDEVLTAATESWDRQRGLPNKLRRPRHRLDARLQAWHQKRKVDRETKA